MRLINILTIATLINVFGLITGCKKNSELTNPPVVTTNAATNISSTSAISGGSADREYVIRSAAYSSGLAASENRETAVRNSRRRFTDEHQYHQDSLLSLKVPACIQNTNKEESLPQPLSKQV